MYYLNNLITQTKSNITTTNDDNNDNNDTCSNYDSSEDNSNHDDEFGDFSQAININNDHNDSIDKEGITSDFLRKPLDEFLDDISSECIYLDALETDNLGNFPFLEEPVKIDGILSLDECLEELNKADSLYQFDYKKSELRKRFYAALDVPINLDTINNSTKPLSKLDEQQRQYTKQDLLNKGELVIAQQYTTENNDDVLKQTMQLASINEEELDGMSLGELNKLETKLNNMNEQFSMGIEYLRNKLTTQKDDITVYNKMAANLIENAQKKNSGKKGKK